MSLTRDGIAPHSCGGPSRSFAFRPAPRRDDAIRDRRRAAQLADDALIQGCSRMSSATFEQLGRDTATMKTTTWITLLASGAILAFAIKHSPSFLNLQVVGWVLIATGALGAYIPRAGSSRQRRSQTARSSA